MNFFKRDHGKILFFTKNSTKRYSGLYSLILSPQFYWIKRVKLPITSEYRAKKLAPSLFDGTLPDGKFEYIIKYEKDRGTFIAIAYDKDYIFSEIQKRFLSNAKVAGIYFAQFELNRLESCISIDGDISLGNVDGLLIQVPSRCVQSEENIRKYLPRVSLNSKKIVYQNSSGDSSKIDLFIPHLTLSILIVLSLLIDYFAYVSKESFNEQKQALIKRHKLPSTSLQLHSIKNTLFKRYKEQLHIRELMTQVDSLSLKPDEKIVKLTITNNDSIMHIKTTNTNKDKIIDELKSKVRILGTSFNENILIVEFNHE
jgi:hypothetical protein